MCCVLCVFINEVKSFLSTETWSKKFIDPTPGPRRSPVGLGLKLSDIFLAIHIDTSLAGAFIDGLFLTGFLIHSL